MKIEMNIRGHTIVFIATYAPTEDANMDLNDDFENNMTTFLDTIPDGKEITMFGDLNARTGKMENDSTVGRFGE